MNLSLCLAAAGGFYEPVTLRHFADRVGFLACSANVKPENAEVLNAIREHMRPKGYLEGGAPPG